MLIAVILSIDLIIVSIEIMSSMLSAFVIMKSDIILSVNMLIAVILGEVTLNVIYALCHYYA
jgi:hypothetical protein